MITSLHQLNPICYRKPMNMLTIKAILLLEKCMQDTKNKKYTIIKPMYILNRIAQNEIT